MIAGKNEIGQVRSRRGERGALSTGTGGNEQDCANQQSDLAPTPFPGGLWAFRGLAKILLRIGRSRQHRQSPGRPTMAGKRRWDAIAWQLLDSLAMRTRTRRTKRGTVPVAVEFLDARLMLSSSSVAPTTSSAVISVNATADVHAINPDIYGASYATTSEVSNLNLTINREGGNNADTYNWQQDAENLDNDYYFESYPQGSGNGQSTDAFVNQTTAGGGQADLTIPIQPYVASLGPNGAVEGSYPVSVYGPQQSTDPYYPNFGNGVSTNGQDLLDTNLYNYVANSPSFEQGWIQHLLSTFGTPANGGVQYFTLGNEPGLWNSTNMDIHPNGETNVELLDDIIAYGSMIKAIDPNAKILGFEEWGWTNYFVDGADAAAGNYGATYTGLNGQQLNAQEWLLQQLAQYQATNGTRLLDYYTLHYYPQESVSGDNDGGVDSDNVDTATELLRNQVTRALWDPTYVDPSWIGTTGINNGIIDLIPTMQGWVNEYYPGTMTGITEYNFGADGNMNGATTQADVYGIFGQQGLDLATRWGVPADGTPTYLAMQLWRNYDGHDSGFGDTSVGTTVADPDQTDAFSAIRSSDGALTVAVINKNLYSASDPSATTSVTINLSGFANNGDAQDWQLAAVNPADQTKASITNLADVHFSGNSFTVNVPMESVSMFVIEPAAGPMITLNPTGMAVIAGQSVSFSAAASGTPTPTVQWQFSTNNGGSFSNISGATSTTYTFSATASENGDEYRAVFTNTGGTATSSAATLTIDAPLISVKDGTTVLTNGSSTDNFGTTTLGTPISQVITVTNSGTAPLIVQPVTATTGFTVTKNFSANQSIAAGASANFTIQLGATALGTPSGTVTFAENDTKSGGSFAFNVTGTITAPKIVVKNGSTTLTNGSSTVNFGSTPLGTSVNQVITVTNTGSATLVVQPVTAPAGFTVTENFTANQAIAAGASATFTLRLNAAAFGTSSGTVTFAENDTTSGGTFSFVVTGTVLSPKIVVNNGATTITNGTSTVNLGSTPVGTPVSQVITVTNSGNAALVVQPVTAPAGFTVTKNFTANQSIAAGTSATFTIQLNATTTGTFNGPIKFEENDSTSGGSFTFNVTGTVTEPKIAVASQMTTLINGSSTVNFGTTVPGAVIVKIFTVTNVGSGTLVVQPATASAGFTVTKNFATNQAIAAGASVSFAIEFKASTIGTTSGTIKFAENAPTSGGSFAFNVLGTVTAPKIVVNDGATTLMNGVSTVNFGTTTVGKPLTQVITVTNSGNLPLVVQPVTVPTGFTVIKNFSRNQSIAAGSSVSFTIQLNATAVGTPGGTVTISDNDKSANPFNFLVKSVVNKAAVGLARLTNAVSELSLEPSGSDGSNDDPKDFD